MSEPFVTTREMINAVHEWRQRRLQDRISRPIGPYLQERFDLGMMEVIRVIQAAANERVPRHIAESAAAYRAERGRQP